MIELPDNLDVGICSHTGLVRSSNEDDYLVLAPSGSARDGIGGDSRLLFLVADGMGGVSGGSEASRAAARALGANFLIAGEDPPPLRMERGFEAACRQVYALSRESPRLRDMGTTLTALELEGRALRIGHVGDSRCMLLRDGRLEPLTEDHAVREPRNLLTRCIGAGQEQEDVDYAEMELLPGDTLVLLTDGVWSMVESEVLAGILQRGSAQDAAEALVHEANRNGGADNSTVLVLRFSGEEARGTRTLELPSGEPARTVSFPSSGISLVAPRWPWVALVVALALATLVVLRLMDVDPWWG